MGNHSNTQSLHSWVPIATMHAWVMCDASLCWCDCVIYGVYCQKYVRTYVKLMLRVIKNANFYFKSQFNNFTFSNLEKKVFCATYKSNVHINLYNFLLKQTWRAGISNFDDVITSRFIFLTSNFFRGKKSQYLILKHYISCKTYTSI